MESKFERLPENDVDESKTINIAGDIMVNKEPIPDNLPDIIFEEGVAEKTPIETNEFFCHDHHEEVIRQAEGTKEDVVESGESTAIPTDELTIDDVQVGHENVVDDVQVESPIEEDTNAEKIDAETEELLKHLPDINDIVNQTMDIDESTAYTDSEKEILRGLQLKATISQIDKMRKDISAARESTIMKPDENDKVFNMVKEKTLEEIKAMDLNAIDAWYAAHNIDIEKDNINYAGADEPGQQKVFRKDILIFFRELYDAEVKFEEEEAKYKKEIEEISAEMEEALNQFGGISDFMEDKFKRIIEDAKEKTDPETYAKMLNAFNNGLTLDIFKNYAKSSKGKRLLRDYKVDKEAEYIYRRYKKTSQLIDFNIDLTKFVNIEKVFLGIDNPNRYNIVIFTIIHWIAMVVPKMERKELKLATITMNRFHLNLGRLIKDQFGDSEEKETFLNAMREIVDIVG